MKPVLMSLLLLCTPKAGFAKSIEFYETSVKVANTNGGGSFDLSGLFGFSCTATLDQREVETIPNYKGEDSPLTFQHKSDFVFTSFGMPQCQGEMPVNFKNKNAHMDIEVTQTCTGKAPSTCYDDHNRSYSCQKDLTLNYEWNCKIPASSFPRQKQGKDFVCEPNNSSWANSFSSSPQAAMLMEIFEKKKITVHLQDLRTEEHFMKLGCDADTDVYKLDPAMNTLLHFSGGISDSTFQRTVNYKVGVNGKDAGEIKRGDGVTNFDVLVCNQSPNGEIHVDLDAKDSNVHYAPQSVLLDPRNGAALQSMDFVRKSWLGDYHSKINEEVQPLPKPEAAAPGNVAPSW